MCILKNHTCPFFFQNWVFRSMYPQEFAREIFLKVPRRKDLKSDQHSINLKNFTSPYHFVLVESRTCFP